MSMRPGKRKILLIEDDPDVVRLLVLLLGALDAEVATAPDGAAGLAFAAANKPDLILMDLNLPRMDGFEAIRALRADQAFADLPVIVLTAHANPENIRRAVDVGADDFLVKANLLAGEGLDRVGRALEARPPRRPLPRTASPFGRRPSPP
jgi:CheY-like chemotaxis protein